MLHFKGTEIRILYFICDKLLELINSNLKHVLLDYVKEIPRSKMCIITREMRNRL